MIDAERLKTDFVRRYARTPRVFGAPGRVNLIGEHTDYNDGFVLPVTLDRRTVVAAAPREDRRIHVHSVNMDESFEFDLADPPCRRRGNWLDYVEGVARCLEDSGVPLIGADLLIESDVPDGAGLSSSAALEVSVGFALHVLAGRTVDRINLALAAQRAEHEYVGTQCGIMDQFMAALGREGYAMLIDCRSLSGTPISFDTRSVEIVICDTRVRHNLAASEYNQRRAECERGVELLRTHLPDIRALRDVGPAEFRQLEDDLPEVIRRRCRHVISENARTRQAADALRNGDYATFGVLMAESHRSLRDDFEVSCGELDMLVDAVQDSDGIYGARMTGGGFGGCTVNLVRRGGRERLIELATRHYYEPMNLEPAVYVTHTGEGATEIG